VAAQINQWLCSKWLKRRSMEARQSCRTNPTFSCASMAWSLNTSESYREEQ
jgi:hypothetical protein